MIFNLDADCSRKIIWPLIKCQLLFRFFLCFLFVEIWWEIFATSTASQIICSSQGFFFFFNKIRYVSLNSETIQPFCWFHMKRISTVGWIVLLYMSYIYWKKKKVAVTHTLYLKHSMRRKKNSSNTIHYRVQHMRIKFEKKNVWVWFSGYNRHILCTDERMVCCFALLSMHKR